MYLDNFFPPLLNESITRPSIVALVRSFQFLHNSSSLFFFLTSSNRAKKIQYCVRADLTLRREKKITIGRFPSKKRNFHFCALLRQMQYRSFKRQERQEIPMQRHRTPVFFFFFCGQSCYRSLIRSLHQPPGRRFSSAFYSTAFYIPRFFTYFAPLLPPVEQWPGVVTARCLC